MKRLPSYKEIKNRYPLFSSQSAFIEENRQIIRSILNGDDPRLLLIVGPCSIHDFLSAKEFARNLKELEKEVGEQFFILMRVYCEKPRTSSGWKGFLYDPLLDGSNDVQLGIEWTRQLLLELSSMNIATATEFLDPLTAFYYEDLISWGSIGARTSSSQTHRQMASGLKIPIGIKNGIAGNISAAINGVLASSKVHSHVALNEDGCPCVIQTQGNCDVHVVLRGGDSGSNYDALSIKEAMNRLEHHNLPLRIVIDCSHQNSGKHYDFQSIVFQSVIHQYIQDTRFIRGLMLESHLNAGRQNLTEDPSNLLYGVSVTDACLDWDSTARLIRWGAERLQEQKYVSQTDKKIVNGSDLHVYADSQNPIFSSSTFFNKL